MIYIFDIDGTLADCSHRLHFIQQKPANWRGFFEACPNDEPIPEVIQVAKALGGVAHIMLLSGRSDEIRTQTLDWLNELQVPCTALFMREQGDHREDAVIKSEMIEHLKRQWADEHIMGIFEDRKQCVDMYRAKGLRVFQVAEGNF